MVIVGFFVVSFVAGGSLGKDLEKSHSKRAGDEFFTAIMLALLIGFCIGLGLSGILKG